MTKNNAQVKVINLSRRYISRTLDLSNFIRLEILDCSYNAITNKCHY